MTLSTQPLPKPYSQLEELIAIRFHVKHRKLAHQQKLASQKGGNHRIQRKGRGMEFSEVRQYQPGDDIRHIDWRVSARTQETHTKIFTEELDKPVLCLVEQTPNLFFGSKKRFKTDQALQVLSAIAWSTLNQGDKIGGLVFNHQSHQWVEPKHQQNSLMKLFHAAIQLQQPLKKPVVANPLYWLSALKQVQKQARPGQKIFLIGDMLQFPSQALPILQTLKRHLDINAIHIVDNLEMALPAKGLGLVRLSDGENELQLNAAEKNYRTEYRNHYETLWQNSLQSFHQIKIPLVAVSTQSDAPETLLKQGVLR